MQDNNPENNSQLYKQLLENQSTELALQEQQLELAKQQDHHSFQFAMRSLELQADNMKKESEHQDKTITKFYYALVVLILLFIIFSWILVHYNQTELLSEIIKALIVGATTGAGGYHYGVSRGKKKAENDD